MKRASLLCLAALTALAGCYKQEESTPFASGPSRFGRYAGVGIYQTDRMWEQLTQAPPADPKAARLSDDAQVIVTVDTRTGELRQCGNLSGHCITMSPWSKPAPTAPALVERHAQELDDLERAAMEPPPK